MFLAISESDADKEMIKDISNINSERFYSNLQIDGFKSGIGNLVAILVVIAGLFLMGMIVFNTHSSKGEISLFGDTSFTVIAIFIFLAFMILYLKIDGMADMIIHYGVSLYERNMAEFKKMPSTATVLWFIFLLCYIAFNWIKPMKQWWIPTGLFFNFSFFSKIIQFLIVIHLKHYYIYYKH